MSLPELLTGVGAALSLFLCCIGACISSAPAGLFAIRSTKLTGFGPIIISGVLAIYGLIVSVILAFKLKSAGDASVMTEKDGFVNLCAGLAVGCACLASGIGMARFIDRSLTTAATSRTQISESEVPLMDGVVSTIGMNKTEFSLRYFLVMVYLEAIGLYGLIVALLLLK